MGQLQQLPLLVKLLPQQIDVGDTVRQTDAAHYPPVRVPDRSGLDPPAFGIRARTILDRVILPLENAGQQRSAPLAELLGARSGHRHDLGLSVEHDHCCARKLSHHDRQQRVD